MYMQCCEGGDYLQFLTSFVKAKYIYDVFYPFLRTKQEQLRYALSL